MKHWVAGIWIYWCIVEMLYEEWWVLMLSECERIAFELRTSCDVVNSIINDYDLFRNDGTWFYSKSILDRLEQRNEKSAKARASAEKRWKDKWIDANALRTQSDGNAIKERKVKKSKTEISKDTEQAPILSEETSRDIETTKKEYGNADINKILLLLKNTVGCDDFSESKEWQRKYGKHFLTLGSKIGNTEFSARLEWILSDDFKAKNCNSLKYLYSQMKSYIHSPIVSNTPKVW